MRLPKPVNRKPVNRKLDNEERGILRVPTLPTVEQSGAEGLLAPPPPSASIPRERHRRSRLEVAGLLALLAGVTAAGVLIGRALEPARVAVTTTTTVAAATKARPKKVAPPPRWGPLVAARAGRLPVGGDVAGAVRLGKRLVAIDRTGAVLAGPVGGALTRIAKLPAPLSAAAAFATGGDVFVVGGKRKSTPTDEILRVRLAAGKVVPAGRFTEPLAESGVVARSGAVYLVGGWTGVKYATAVIRFVPPSRVAVVARLPGGLRAPAVALVGSRLFVAGGLTQSGLSRKVFAVDTGSGRVTTLAELPQAVDRAVLVVSGAQLYLLGGRSAAGKPVDAIVRIDPRTGRVSRAGRMPAPLAGATAVPDGGRTLVVGTPSGLIYRVG